MLTIVKFVHRKVENLMNVQLKNQVKGFTIIEVVLVLAIAGLIFLMVFLALPALQRGQRDSQRRGDASKFISQVQSYSVNNKGKVPPATDTEVASFASSYLKWKADESGEFNDPSTGKGYTLKAGIGVPSDTTQIYYGGPNTTCDGETLVSAGGNNRSAALAMKLEGSGIYCQSNQ